MASLWTETAASWVNLNPAGATNGSDAKQASGGQQGGYVLNASDVAFASLWSGTAASWVNLNPAGAGESIALGVNGGQQVGYAFVGGSDPAGIWSGTAASWINLGSLLRANFSNSEASGIWTAYGTTYVAGYAENATTSEENAILWETTSTPEPYSLAILGLGGAALLRKHRLKH